MPRWHNPVLRKSSFERKPGNTGSTMELVPARVSRKLLRKVSSKQNFVKVGKFKLRAEKPAGNSGSWRFIFMYLPPHLKITENKAKGRIVIAAVPIAKNELVCELFFDSVVSSNQVSRNKAVQVGHNTFLNNKLNTIDDYFNHSCEPNIAINFSKATFYALRDIKIGEEISWNYLTSEYDLVKTGVAFDCKCNSKNCIGAVKGFKYLTKAQKQELRPYLSPYLRTLY